MQPTEPCIVPLLLLLLLLLLWLRTACLKDLARFLRRDDPETRDALFKLGQLQTVENDICPLLVAHPTDAELVYHARE
jgi:hypothetical protein